MDGDRLLYWIKAGFGIGVGMITAAGLASLFIVGAVTYGPKIAHAFHLVR